MAPGETVESFQDRSATRTLRGRISSGYLEAWPRARDRSWYDDADPNRLVVVLALVDGTSAFYIAYPHPIWPERILDALRPFGWDGAVNPDGVPILEAANILVTVESQFQIGFGFVPTVIAARVVSGLPDEPTRIVAPVLDDGLLHGEYAARLIYTTDDGLLHLDVPYDAEGRVAGVQHTTPLRGPEVETYARSVTDERATTIVTFEQFRENGSVVAKLVGLRRPRGGEGSPDGSVT